MRTGVFFCVLMVIHISLFSFADDSLVAYWPLDGDASDASGYDRDGAEVGNPAWSTDGYQGGCVQLNGVDDYIEITDYKGIIGSASRTCSAWIKTTVSSGEIISWGDNSSGARWNIRVNEGGQLRAEVSGGNIIGTTLINDGNWHHVAVVLEDDGDPDIIEAKLYVDGLREVISSSVDEAVNTAAQENVSIGVFQPFQRYFSGSMDDVRIYDTALTESEIIELYMTAGDVIEISTAEELIAMGSDPEMMDKSFILTADIDLSAYTFNRAVIAPNTNDNNDYVGTAFSGKFNGHHHKITNLTIQNGTYYQGLFGCIETTGGVINLGIENCLIDFSVIPNKTFIGGLAGNNKGMIYSCYAMSTIHCGDGSVIGGIAGINHGWIKRCHAWGQIEGPAGLIGGFVGINAEDGSIAESYATTSINAESALGGFVGLNSGQINTSYSTGSVTGSLSYGYYGGFCGKNAYPGLIANCYSTGDITCTDGGHIGGFCGSFYDSVVVHCYATGQGSSSKPYQIGGLFGEGFFSQDSEISGCFWDIEASGLTTACAPSTQIIDLPGTFGRATAFMQEKNVYVFQGWDFVGETINGQEDIWRICSNGSSYPQFNWEFEDAGDDDCDEIVEINPLGGGSGTVNDPYVISDPLGLYELSVMNQLGSYLYIVLTEDIDMSGINMNSPIGPFDGAFNGFFEGNHHTIYHLTISCKELYDVGLFGSVGLPGYTPFVPSVIQNLHLENVSITGGTTAGAIAGGVDNGDIINCSSTGSVSLVDDLNYPAITAGGLVGGLWKGNIRNCASSCTVTSARAWSMSSYAGGLVGKSQGTISDCYADGSVSAYNAGGLVGIVYRYGGVVSNCYSATHIEDICKITGGITAINDEGGVVTGSFWDTSVSGTSNGIGDGDASGVTGAETAEMKIQSMFTAGSWDFVGEDVNGQNNTWRMCVDGVDYPRLSWEFAKNGDFACGDGVDLDDLAALAMEWLSDAAVWPETFNRACDANGDEVINLEDFGVLSENWK